MRKFLFIDDHAVVRASFTKILSEPFLPVEVEEAGNETEAIEQLKKNTFDLVIMDVQMPDTDTMGLVDYIRNTSPQTRILMLSMAAENVHAKRFLKAGANGYVSKQAPLEDVTKAMETVLMGKNYVSSSLAEALLRNLTHEEKDNPFDNLSKREYEIVTLMLKGTGMADISKSLHLAPSTISTHKMRLFEKLGVSNLIELKDLAAAHNV